MGEAENLVAVHNRYLLEAMIDLQRFIPCLQEKNTHQVPHCATLFHCGMSVMGLPRGRIRAVYTISGGKWCDKVYYDGMEYPDLLCYAKGQTTYEPPANAGLPVLGQGFQYADKSTDSTCGYGRTRHGGKYAKDRGRLFLAPWIQSNEDVIIEFDGLKRDWKDTDLTTDDADFVKAVGLYILTQKAIKQGCTSEGYVTAKKEYDDQYADLAWECEEEMKVGENRFCNDDSPMDVRTDDEVDTTVTPYVLAVIGDYGYAYQQTVAGVTPEETVATMVKAWGPSAIITTGDNNYPDGAFPSIDINIGKFYSDYIFPYKGSFGLGSIINKFWPVMGNHDWDTSNGLAYANYFTLPNNGRYYDLILGPIHFFFISTDPREPNGINSSSIQAKWIQAKAAQSTVPWKILVGHHPPYTSDITHSPGSIPLRWKFKELGFDAALFGHGHSYERFDMAGFPIFVNGAGGAPLRGYIASPISESKARYNSLNGAMKIEATCDYIKFTFINTGGVEFESITIEAPLAATGKKPKTVDTSALIGTTQPI